MSFWSSQRLLTGSTCSWQSWWISEGYCGTLKTPETSLWLTLASILDCSLAVLCWWPPWLDYLPHIPPEHLETSACIINPSSVPLNNVYHKPFEFVMQRLWTTATVVTMGSRGVTEAVHAVDLWKPAGLLTFQVTGGVVLHLNEYLHWVWNLVSFARRMILSLVLKPLKVFAVLRPRTL